MLRAGYNVVHSRSDSLSSRWSLATIVRAPCPKVQLTATFLPTILLNVSDYSHTEKGSRTDAGGDTTEDPGSNRQASSDERAGTGDHQGDRPGNRPLRGRALQAL